MTPSLGDSELEIDNHLMICGNKAVKISQNMKEYKNVIMVAIVKAAAHFEEADVWESCSSVHNVLPPGSRHFNNQHMRRV